MILSLDSSTVIDLLRDRDPRVREQFNRARETRARLVLSSLALSELSYGVAKGEAGRREGKLRKLDDLMIAVEVIPFGIDDAMAAGALRAGLPAGRSIGASDVLIAAQALARDWIIVTSDIRHFGRIQGLRLINWRHGGDLLTYCENTSRYEGGSEEK